jgi:hypothetical protein
MRGPDLSIDGKWECDVHSILVHFQQRESNSSIIPTLSQPRCKCTCQTLNKPLERLKAPKNYVSVIQGPHPILEQLIKICNRRY